MKFTLSWLKDHLDTDAEAATIAETLTRIGLEVEGVEAEGKRITHTIPAGEIGNDRPIEIVSESWYSSELQVLVMTRHSDPRRGETTYRLTNINRAEPDRSLFEVPADYTVRDTSITVPDRKLRRRSQEEQ